MNEPTHLSYEYSEAVIHNEGDTVRLEWRNRGRTHNTLVSDVLIEEWTQAENQRRAFKRALEAIAAYGGGDGGDWVECCNIAREALDAAS